MFYEHAVAHAGGDIGAGQIDETASKWVPNPYRTRGYLRLSMGPFAPVKIVVRIQLAHDF